MPIKCMPQMPPPMLKAPAPVQAQRPQADVAAAIREDTDSATNAATIAITIESVTSEVSNSPW